MSNTILIKHGEGKPTNKQLQPYELGFDKNSGKLYVGNENEEPSTPIVEKAEYSEAASSATTDQNGELLTDYVHDMTLETNTLKVTHGTGEQTTTEEIDLSGLTVNKANLINQTNVGSKFKPVYLKSGKLYACELNYGFDLPNDEDGEPDGTLYFYVSQEG